MDNVLDFKPKHADNSEIPPVYVGDDGTRWYEYMLTYRFNNQEYCFEIWATSDEDARQRLNTIKSNVKMAGKIART